MGVTVGGIAGQDVYGSGGNISAHQPSTLVQATGSDASTIGGQPAKWWVGIAIVLVVLRFAWERAK